MRFLRVALSATLAILILPIIAIANDITLTSRDGSIELQGELVGYDGEYFRIETEYGILTVDGSGVVCDGPGCPGLGGFVAHLTFSGAGQLSVSLLPALIESFALQYNFVLQRKGLSETSIRYDLFEAGENGAKAAEFILRTNTSAEGIQDLISGDADFALTLREVTDTEINMAREVGLGNLASLRQARVIALDAIVPIVSHENPVSHLSLEKLAEIFAGKIDNWSLVGGEDAPISIYLPVENIGFSNLFVQDVVQRFSGEGLSNTVIRLPTNTNVVTIVSDDPFGIGISQFSRTDQVKVVTLSGECSFELAANSQSIKTKDYPLTAPFYLYIPARRLPRVGREFLGFLRTEAAQLAIRNTGLIDQLPEKIPVEEQGRRLVNAILAAGDGIELSDLKHMAGLMAEHTRLSVTFRFQDSSSRLDASSLSNALLLANALEAGEYDGQVIRFIGFADGQGEASVNQRLALKRAEEVLRAVRQAAETLDEGRVGLFVETLGEALPMACDDSAWGRQVNRRVEVWLQDAGE